jgi:hypothetical protein
MEVSMMNRVDPARPSAGKLRVAAAALTRADLPDVAAWLTAQAVEQDFEERAEAIAAETGRNPDDEYVRAAAQKLVETDVKD